MVDAIVAAALELVAFVVLQGEAGVAFAAVVLLAALACQEQGSVRAHPAVPEAHRLDVRCQVLGRPGRIRGVVVALVVVARAAVVLRQAGFHRLHLAVGALAKVPKERGGGRAGAGAGRRGRDRGGRRHAFPFNQGIQPAVPCGTRTRRRVDSSRELMLAPLST